MADCNLTDLSLPYEIEGFASKSLAVDSRELAKNPLQDSSTRYNYVLIPSSTKNKSWPVIFHLSGYFSTGYQSFNRRTLEANIPQWLSYDTMAGKIAPAIHVFVDAMSWWGGSQFIDSAGCGNYQSYILNELVPGIKQVADCSDNWWLVGGSSGGYGALNLLSADDSPFRGAIAIAPDSAFEISLLPDLLKAASQLDQFKDLQEIRRQVERGELQDKRHFFALMNVIAMAHCYSAKGAVTHKKIDWPIDIHSGEVKNKIWQHWKLYDPVVFLPKRIKNLKKKSVYLDVGKYDEHGLHFGTRQIAEILKKHKVKHKLTEFSGGHRNLSQRRRHLLEVYKSEWK